MTRGTPVDRYYLRQQLYVYGNPITVIASYHGIAVEELTAEELDAFHPDYPVATAIAVPNSKEYYYL